jgi:hypothetical protein
MSRRRTLADGASGGATRASALRRGGSAVCRASASEAQGASRWSAGATAPMSSLLAPSSEVASAVAVASLREEGGQLGFEREPGLTFAFE